MQPTATQAKQAARNQLKFHIEQFLKNGGQIQRCDHTSNATYKPRAFSLSETRKCRNGCGKAVTENGKIRGQAGTFCSNECSRAFQKRRGL